MTSAIMFHYTATATVRPPLHAAEGETHAAKARIDKNVSPHTLRRSFATHIHRETSKTRLAQKPLGHSDLSLMMIYTHIFDEEAESALKPFRKTMAMIV